MTNNYDYPFKVGDIVKCLHNINPESLGEPFSGHTYVVISVKNGYIGVKVNKPTTIYYSNDIIEGTNPNWSTSLFILVKKRTKLGEMLYGQNE